MSHKQLKAFAIVASIFASVATSARAAKMDVTACGQQVPAKTVATLQVDLTGCPSDGTTLILGDQVKLYLNDHVIGSGDIGVLCGRRCVVRGPGEITGARDGLTIAVNPNARIKIEDVDIHGNAEHGVSADGGVEASKAPRVRLKNVSVHDNGGTGVFVWQGFLSGSDVTVTNNVFHGLSGIQEFKFKRLTVQNNARDGLIANFGSGRLIDSLLSFNGTLEGDVDLRTLTFPTLENTECGFSATFAGGVPWGVCAGD